MSSSLQIVEFDFRGDRLPLLVDHRGRFASFARCCRFLGLDPSRELARIQGSDALITEMRIERDEETGKPAHFIRAEAVPTWLLFIPSAQIASQFRAKHTAYCRELIAAVYDFTTKGVAISDNVNPLVLIQAVQEKLESLQSAQLDDRTKILLKSAYQSALALQSGQSHQGEKTYDVGYRIECRGIKSTLKDVQSIGITMARRYREIHKRDPQTGERFINGRQCRVKWYTEADLPLLDSVIDSYFSTKRK